MPTSVSVIFSSCLSASKPCCEPQMPTASHCTQKILSSFKRAEAEDKHTCRSPSIAACLTSQMAWSTFTPWAWSMVCSHQ